jgi:subtilisin family serine protease
VKGVHQQQILHRVKRRIVHDKQKELPIHHYANKNVYERVFDAPDSKIDADDRTSKSDIPQAHWINQMQFDDPLYRDQWYYVRLGLQLSLVIAFQLSVVVLQDNKGQTGGAAGIDLNVIPVWKKGLTGRGVVVSILDDGIDHTHPDLRENYVSHQHVLCVACCLFFYVFFQLPEASTDLNDRGSDPMPDVSNLDNRYRLT